MGVVVETWEAHHGSLGLVDEEGEELRQFARRPVDYKARMEPMPPAFRLTSEVTWTTPRKAPRVHVASAVLFSSEGMPLVSIGVGKWLLPRDTLTLAT